jgi:hypothetical protein
LTKKTEGRKSRDTVLLKEKYTVTTLKEKCNSSFLLSLSGHTLVEQECNTQACPGSWGCWSEWSRCTVAAAGGRRSRNRACLADFDSSDTGLVDCGAGEGREEEPCHVAAAEEEDHLSSSSAAAGRPVLRPRDGAEPVAATAGMVPLNMVVGACVAGFMIGGLLGAVLTYYYMKNKKPGGGGLGCGGGGSSAVGSPHYISAKSQNLYVSLPMLDLKHKQLSSAASDYSGTLRSNATGTLRSSKAGGGGGGSSVYGGSNSKPGDYETATIKRSHSRRDSSLLSGLVGGGGGGGGIRADLDSDTLFT